MSVKEIALFALDSSPVPLWPLVTFSTDVFVRPHTATMTNVTISFVCFAFIVTFRSVVSVFAVATFGASVNRESFTIPSINFSIAVARATTSGGREFACWFGVVPPLVSAAVRVCAPGIGEIGLLVSNLGVAALVGRFEAGTSRPSVGVTVSSFGKGLTPGGGKTRVLGSSLSSTPRRWNR